MGARWLIVFASACSLAQGCLKSATVSSEIDQFRDADTAIRSLHDFEVARSVYKSLLGDLERLHYLAPHDETALVLLVRTWTEHSLFFVQDAHHQARELKDPALAEYELMRAQAGLERAIHYGEELLSGRSDSFETVRADPKALRDWLSSHTGPGDAALLLWLGYARLGQQQLNAELARRKRGKAADSNAMVTEALLRRSLALSERVEYGLAHAVLGMLYADQRPPALERSRQQFAKVKGQQHLLVRWLKAVSYYCARGDRAGFERQLDSILKASPELPQLRLYNVIAKRLARRASADPALYDACGF